MAYDETSFLSGIALGRAMKGISMANPNRGGTPHVEEQPYCQWHGEGER